jgi:hypothetical protein
MHVYLQVFDLANHFVVFEAIVHQAEMAYYKTNRPCSTNTVCNACMLVALIGQSQEIGVIRENDSVFSPGKL